MTEQYKAYKRAQFLETYFDAMERVLQDRAEEVGAHTWKIHAARYGPKVLFAEIISITSRIEALIWKRDIEHGLTGRQLSKLEDLTIDLGNYTLFLFNWTQEQFDKRGSFNRVPGLGTQDDWGIKKEGDSK